MRQVGLWIEALRLPTLPLAWSGVGLGSALAYASGRGRMDVTLLSLLTASLLQCISNLANDLGDHRQGADHIRRQGPRRALARGQLTIKQMNQALIGLVIGSLITGNVLLWRAFLELPTPERYWIGSAWLAVGLVAIGAAIFYTYAPRKPYGYSGWGDAAVLTFFGYIALLGTYYLHTLHMNLLPIGAATGIGLGAVVVLNINNLRDIESDKKAHKRSIALRLGLTHAIRYHWSLCCGCLFALIGTRIAHPTALNLWDIAFAVACIIFVLIAKKVQASAPPHALTATLRQIAFALFALSVTLSLSII